MARFHTLKQKSKRYVFDFLGNRDDPNPAAAVFSRFPLPGEAFAPKAKPSAFKGVDVSKIGDKDGAEAGKFIKAFADDFEERHGKADYARFAEECIERFEDFIFDGKEIKTVEDFNSLNVEVTAVIADDCLRYARERDEFSMGE